jgi:Ca-activated chloride channel family protein
MAALIVPARSESSDAANDPNSIRSSRAPVLEYNAGTNAYRAGQYSQATQSFQQSIKTAPASNAKRLADQEDAYYNLGNALYRAGQQLEKSAPQEAIEKWTEAVKAYDTALQLRADDADSKYNRDLVNRKIDALRKPPDDSGGGGGGGGGKGQGQGKPPPPQGKPPPPQGQPPPPQGQPPAQGQPPPQGQPPAQGQPPPQGQPPQGQPPPQGGAEAEANDQRQPGQMSPEEARELLDSEKSDEHHSLAVPLGPRNPDQTPDKAFKNW